MESHPRTGNDIDVTTGYPNFKFLEQVFGCLQLNKRPALEITCLVTVPLMLCV